MQEKDHGFLVAQSWTKSDANRVLGARSIGLIRIRRTPALSYDAFDWAQLNPDESSELIHVSRKKLRMSSDELDPRTLAREDVKVLRLPHSDLNRTVA